MISIILPAYNEEKNIGIAIDDIADFFTKIKMEYEIIVVNDGSKDGTAKILNQYKTKKNIVAVSHFVNMGYGAALRSGFKKAKGDWIFFTDSDRQFDINDIAPFLKKITDYDFVIGYRENRKDLAHRIFYAKIFGFMSQMFFGVKVKDIDCAFKLFKKNVIKDVPLKENGALINLEILALAKKRGCKFLELPVNHFKRTEGRQTGGSFKVVFKALFNFLKLWKDLK